jgi:hypothetical protein
MIEGRIINQTMFDFNLFIGNTTLAMYSSLHNRKSGSFELKRGVIST